MQQFEYLNEILIRFNEHNGNYQGAHVRNIKGVRDENGKILFAQMTDPVGLDTLPDLNDLFGDLAQSLLVEIEEKDSLIEQKDSLITQRDYFIEQKDALIEQLQIRVAELEGIISQNHDNEPLS